jgi:hypothetical protein
MYGKTVFSGIVVMMIIGYLKNANYSVEPKTQFYTFAYKQQERPMLCKILCICVKGATPLVYIKSLYTPCNVTLEESSLCDTRSRFRSEQ